MIFEKTIVLGVLVGAAMVSAGCMSATDRDGAGVETTFDNATVRPEGASFVVSGLTDGVPNSVVASRVTFDDVAELSSGLRPSASNVRIRCYFCICKDTDCRCTEIDCP